MKIRSVFLIILIGFILGWGSSGQAETQTVDQMQAALRDSQQKVEALQKKAAELSAALATQQKQRLNLANQLTQLSTQISKTKVDIDLTQALIAQTDLEISGLENGITNKTTELANDKTHLAQLLREQQRLSRISPFLILFRNASLADYLRDVYALQLLGTDISNIVKRVSALKQQLVDTKQAVEQKQQEQQSRLRQLAQQRAALQKTEENKKFLLIQTKSSESRYQQLLNAARQEQNATEAQIASLEKTIRSRLQTQGIDQGSARPNIVWPVSNARGVSATFHDPDYPFRGAFEHTGIDIRALQGTPIRAAANGYVATTQTGGARGYGYVAIVHGGGLSTVYGHVSQILVQTNSYVTQGQIIALSGGKPGTPGAGPFTTGAHLHFEVRQNSKPIDPLPLLP